MRHCISPHDYLVQIISNPCPSSTDLCRLGTYQSHENVTVYVGATAVTASVVVDALKPATTYKVWAVLRSYASAVQGEVRRDSTVQGIVLEYSYLAGRRTNKMVLVVKERVLALHYCVFTYWVFSSFEDANVPWLYHTRPRALFLAQIVSMEQATIADGTGGTTTGGTGGTTPPTPALITSLTATELQATSVAFVAYVVNYPSKIQFVVTVASQTALTISDISISDPSMVTYKYVYKSPPTDVFVTAIASGHKTSQIAGLIADTSYRVYVFTAFSERRYAYNE